MFDENQLHQIKHSNYILKIIVNQYKQKSQRFFKELTTRYSQKHVTYGYHTIRAFHPCFISKYKTPETNLEQGKQQNRSIIDLEQTRENARLAQVLGRVHEIAFKKWVNMHKHQNLLTKKKKNLVSQFFNKLKFSQVVIFYQK